MDPVYNINNLMDGTLRVLGKTDKINPNTTVLDFKKEKKSS